MEKFLLFSHNTTTTTSHMSDNNNSNVDPFTKKRRRVSEGQRVPPPLPKPIPAPPASEEKGKEKRIIQTDEDLNQVRVFVCTSEGLCLDFFSKSFY